MRRYRDKLNIIVLRMEQVYEWMGSEDDFKKDEKTKLAIYKAFQEIVEAVMDIIAMMLVDSKITPKDDYTNIEEIGRIMDFDKEILKEANGLRNVIVHRYNGVDDIRAYEGIKRITSYFKKFVEEVEKWIRKKL